MATTDIQNSVYKTIDVIVKKRIDDLHLDKTIECIVENCIDLESGKYRVKYGAGYFDAYSINGDIYFPNTAVYVLVPENNFNNKKTIIGKVSSGLKLATEEEISHSNYNILGKNILIPVEEELNDGYFKIASSSLYDNKNQMVLYDIEDSANNKLVLDKNSFDIYLKETQGFILSGKFKTNAKTKTGQEDFGLIFEFSQKSSNSSYPTMQARWDAEAENIKVVIDGETRSLDFYKNSIDEIFNSEDYKDKTVIQIQNEINNVITALQLFKIGIDESNRNGLELTELYTQLLNELATYTINVNNNPITKEDLKNQFEAWFNGASYGYQIYQISYSLNTDAMTGNPYRYSNDRYQYFFVDIDPEKFIGLDKIIFYSEFDRTDGSENPDFDLWVKDVSIECIKYVNSTNGDYRLSLDYSDIYFPETASDKTQITVSAKIIYQNTNDVTDYSRFLWFRKNENVKIGDINYNSYGGEGWEHLTNMLNTTIYDRSPVLTLYSEDNKVYRNRYKIVAVYEDSFPVEQEFIIYNKKHNHNVELSSDSGLYFKSSDTVIKKTITCKIDENVVPPSEDYSFEWYIDNTKVRTKEELKEWETDINQRIQNGENVTTEELNEYKFISNVEIIESNIITVSSTILDDIHKQVTVVCKIFILDNIFDIVEIVLKNQLSGQISVQDYYIEIENGNQVFQYNEAGISPTSIRYEDPQKTLQLSCKLYDPAGGYIDRLSYTEIAWIVPIENTLIQVDNNLLQDNSNGLKNRIIGDICNFSIAEEYNYSSTNNQIICEIKYDGVTYRQSTNFFFGKVGDDGTNGTDVVAKISPITLSDILTEELLTLEIDETNEANITQEWNNGLSTDSENAILKLELFKNNELIEYNKYKNEGWSILNNNASSKYWRVGSIQKEETIPPRVLLNYDKTYHSDGYTNYIVKGKADLIVNKEADADPVYQTYFGFYPICTVTKKKDVKYRIGINKERTLRHVMYNSDGRNPQYNKNLGVGLIFTNTENGSKYLGDDYSRTIIWEAKGGLKQGQYNEQSPSFSIGRTKTVVPSVGNTEQSIEELKTDRENALNSALNNQKDEYMTDLNETLEEITNNITNNLENINDSLERKKGQIREKWETDFKNYYNPELFNNEQNYYGNAWRLCNTGINNNWTDLIEGLSSESLEKGFKNCVDSYLTYLLKIDEQDRPYFGYDIENIEEPYIETQDLLSLSLNSTKDYQSIFKNLIATIVVGYRADLINFDKDNRLLIQEINLLTEELLELQKQNDKYKDVVIPEDIDSKGKIKDILFNDGEIDNSFSKLTDLFIQQKQQYTQELTNIAEPYDFQINYLENDLEINADPTFCSVLPDEFYSGEFTNQYVKASVYKEKPENLELEYEIIVPFHMYLNSYGLGLLNGWDGNGLEINEEDGYILSPQMGAGKKNSDNTFTGLVMGSRKEYDSENNVKESIGLFGFKEGKQSIALDSVSGSAVFGLPELDGEITDGRIELNPGGISSISQWKIDARSLYNVIPSEQTELLELTQNALIKTQDSSKTELGPRYEDAPQYAHGSIPHEKQGILISALPAYMSFKGRTLTEEDHDDKKINFLNLNTTARQGDSFELQIDPNDSKFFTLYEHSTRLDYGEAFCNQVKNLKNILSSEQLSSYRNDNDYLIYQRYYKGNNVKNKILSRLDWESLDKWELISPAVKNRNEELGEYVVGELYQYKDWNTGSGQVWKFISFTDEQEVLINDYNIDAENKNLIWLSIKDNIETKVWRRYRKAGIDATGKFTAESLGTGSLGMGLGDIKAFDDLSTYIGTSLETDNAPIIQFFTDKYPTGTADTSPVYISSSKTLTGTSLNEGKRPLYIYADKVSGIFVGENAQKDPSDLAKMSKIKLESSINSQKITLSALNTNDKKSNLTLYATGTGSLYHSNNWNTSIGGSLTVTSGAMIKTVNGNFNNTVTGTFNNIVKSDFNNTVSGSFNNTVSGSFKLESKDRENKLINAITVTNSATKISNIKNIALLSGSVENISSNYGTQINAVTTTAGIALRTCRSGTISDLPTYGTDRTGSVGLFLIPGPDDDKSIPRFRLTVGGKTKNNVIIGNSSISNNINDDGKGVIVITPNLNIEDGNVKGILNAGTINAKKYIDPNSRKEVSGNIVADRNITAYQGNITASQGDIIASQGNIKGNFIGNGKQISNTADGWSVSPSGGGSVSVGESITINIPNITFNNQGRPFFGYTTPIPITINQLNDNIWAKCSWVQDWVDGQNYIKKELSPWRNINLYTADDSYNKNSIQGIINTLIGAVNLLGGALS